MDMQNGNPPVGNCDVHIQDTGNIVQEILREEAMSL